MTALLDDGLQKYTDAIVTVAKLLKKKPKVLEAALAQIPLQKQDAARKGMHCYEKNSGCFRNGSYVFLLAAMLLGRFC